MIPEWNHELRGRSLVLDFINTSGWRGRSGERLDSYVALLAWACAAGILPADRADLLAETAERHAGAARSALARARRLRESLRCVFEALAIGGPIPPGELGHLNEILSEAMGHLRVLVGRSGPEWAWEERESLERVLWPIARAAAELLVSEERGRVRACADDHCGWLFLDTSRNRSRRWCSMRDCGNRAKARRHYRRMRAAS